MSCLIPREDLFSHLIPLISPEHHERLKACLLKRDEDSKRSQNAVNWLSWTECQKDLKRVSASIPPGILPSHLEGDLTDVKVQSRGPDDKIYDQNASFRQKVARGNCVLELRNSATSETSSDCVIFALKKFTGGLGDDDDRSIRDGFKWQKYFVKPIVNAERVICTRKMNGEAAHFAVRWMEKEFYIIAGSKNVHLLFRQKDDIKKYSDTRYLVARDVAASCFDFFEQMEETARSALFSFFHHTNFTAVLEILQPHYQHIEDLSYLPSPRLYFISWSETHMEAGVYEDELCIPPDFGQEVAKAFNLSVTGCDIVLHKNLAEKLTQIRKGHGYEGEVLYFVDKDDKVIGLLKKKTVWYIIVRAIREKSKNAAAKIRKNPGAKFDLGEAVTRTCKRLKEIQKWLGLDDAATLEWESVAVGFLKWLGTGLNNGRVSSQDLFGLYPVLWTKYLKESGKSDNIQLSTITAADDPDALPAGSGGGGDGQEDEMPDSD